MEGRASTESLDDGPIEHPRRALDERQIRQLERYEQLLRRYNARVNLISRATEGELRERHIDHALALASRRFPAGADVADWGTGGGLPAIPLAIAFPETRFHAIDSRSKKIQAVKLMSTELGLDNLTAYCVRAENWKGHVHYSVSRGTADLSTLWRWHLSSRVDGPRDLDAAHWPPGLICLKGGDMSEEIRRLRHGYSDIDVDRLRWRPEIYSDKYIIIVRSK